MQVLIDVHDKNVRMVRLCQETLCNNGRYEAWLSPGNSHNSVVYCQKHKVWVLEQGEHFENKIEQIMQSFSFATKPHNLHILNPSDAAVYLHQMGWVIKQLFHACV